MNSVVVIPARFASQRFPGKPLALIAGKPMIQHVWERCRAAVGVSEVIVATEDERIVEACRRFGGRAEMTGSGHASGTDRVAEVALRHPEFDLVVNVQGDEPAIEPETVSATIQRLAHPDSHISTAATPVFDEREIVDPNVVKVVVSGTGRALYFSRAPIPFPRNPEEGRAYLRHLGIYGFRRSALLEVSQLPQTRLERMESLEQLRWLEAGYRIDCAIVESRSIGIDTLSDLERLLSRDSLTFPS